MNGQTSAFTGSILLVEDSEIISLDTADMLLDFGFLEVLVARTVAEATDLLEAHGPKLRALLLDLELDGESGEPIAEAARAAGLPVVVATGHADVSGHAALVSAPLLRKPYSESDLRLALTAALAAPMPPADEPLT